MTAWFQLTMIWIPDHAMSSFTGNVEQKVTRVQIDRIFWPTFQSHPVGINGRNNIIAVTPMKFLPVVEFEKRQKSVNQNKNRAIMSSMITKIGF